MPKILGGDPDKAKEHFEKCLKLSNEKFMLAYVYLARYHAQPLLDEALFDEYLNKVIQSPVEILPGNELITAIAKNKAKRLATLKEELF